MNATQHEHRRKCHSVMAGLSVVLSAAVLLSACPQPIDVAQEDRLPDAAVAPYVKQPACSHEPREVAPVDHIEGDLLARLVRPESGALVVRAEKSTSQKATTLVLEKVSRNGSLTKVASTDDTGEPGAVVGLDAVIGGGNLLVALTRPEGRVELLTLDSQGRTKAPRQTLRSPNQDHATIVWFNGAPLLSLGGDLLRPDGSRPELVDASSEAVDAGDGDGDPPTASGVGPDGGASPGNVGDGGVIATTIDLPEGIRSVVVAGDTLGWLRSDDQGIWLDHVVRDQAKVASTQVAAGDHSDVRLLWAGDRYLVGDSSGADLSRFIVARPRARSKRHLLSLDLGGRMVLPRPPSGVIWTAWDNACARHVGLAQLIGPRHLRFVNAALRGTVLDAAIHIRRERDIVASDVVWDGRGYVLIWSERLDERSDQLVITRFICPDEGSQ